MNCIIVDDDILATKIIIDYVHRTPFLKLENSFKSAIEALPFLAQKNNIQLMFLDVEMPELSGIELLQAIKELPQVIIMSAQQKYAIDAFEHDVVDYLLKPYTYARFYKSVSKAYNQYKINQDKQALPESHIFVKSNQSYIKIKKEEIVYIEALENYVKLHTTGETHILHQTMKTMEEQLSDAIFARVHRSYIINIHFIKEIENHIIHIKTASSQISIPVSRGSRTDLYQKIKLQK
jgi:DNA-binding LytR/AlgR family response regulator